MYLDLHVGLKNLTENFSDFFKKKFNKFPAPRTQKFQPKLREPHSSNKLMIKVTFRHAEKDLKVWYTNDFTKIFQG